MIDFPEDSKPQTTVPAVGSFRRAVLHGLGVVLPPLLTIVVFLWAWKLISDHVLAPIENVARDVIVTSMWDVRTRPPPAAQAKAYRQLNSGEWIPAHIYESVKINPGAILPQSALGYYERYVTVTWLRRSTVVPLFLAVFVLVLYVLGKFFGAGVGRLIWRWFEGLINRLPVIRNVYSSVKQVTDFVFSERQVGFNRVVAVEYPRHGIWAIAFVTGEGMLDVRAAANEPMLSVLIPTSPIPGTGFTVIIRKSEVLDLNMTVDQALQYLVSCGVVIPFGQQPPEESSHRLGADFSAKLPRRSSKPAGSDHMEQDRVHDGDA